MLNYSWLQSWTAHSKLRMYFYNGLSNSGEAAKNITLYLWKKNTIMWQITRRQFVSCPLVEASSFIFWLLVFGSHNRISWRLKWYELDLSKNLKDQNTYRRISKKIKEPETILTSNNSIQNFIELHRNSLNLLPKTNIEFRNMSSWKAKRAEFFKINTPDKWHYCTRLKLTSC